MHKHFTIFLAGTLATLFLGACGTQQSPSAASAQVTEPALVQDFSAEDPNVVFAPIDPNVTAPETTPGTTQDSNTVPCTTCTTHGNSPNHHGVDPNDSTTTASNSNATNGNAVNGNAINSNTVDGSACHGNPQMLGQNGVIRACSQRSVPIHLRGALADPASMTITGPNGYSISGTARRSGESCEYHYMWSVGTAVEGDYVASVNVAGASPFIFHINVQAGSCP